MRSPLLFAVLASLTAGPEATQAQQAGRDTTRAPLTGTASITGVVMSDESSSLPVRRAIVAANGYDATAGIRANRVAVTDDRGRFAITDLPPGRFTLTVTKAGWITGYYGSARPGRGPGSPIPLTDGERAQVEVKMTRGAVIAGRVVDEHGNPQVSVRPMLMEYRVVGGQRRLVQAAMTGPFILSQTNDLGEYRVYGVVPGSYVIAVQPGFQSTSMAGARLTTAEEVRWATQQGAGAAASATAAPPPGQAVTYAPVYYPGVAAAAAATTITLRGGEERLGVDIVMPLVSTAKVEGVVRRADGQPVRNAQINIMPARQESAGEIDFTIRPSVDAQGRFTMPAVRPGDYVIVARAASQAPSGPLAPGAPPVRQTLDLWGMTDITVGGRDIAGLTVTLQPGLTVSGRLAFEASTLKPPEEFTSTRVMMMSPSMADVGMTGTVSAAQMSNMFMSPVTAGGAFTTSGVMPGRYLISASVPSRSTGGSWMMKSITVRGQESPSGFEVRPGEDLTDVVITFTDRVAEVSGTLLDGANRPAPEYFVFVFPVDKAAWTAMSSRMRPPVKAARDGTFKVGPLLPGEYYVAALTDFEYESMYDASFLEQVAAAAFKITLADGEKKVQDLKIR